jgi:putative sigma-54 modulation protein
MTFTITGRNVNVSDRLSEYVEKKIPRLEKYFHQLMEVRVIIFTEKQDHIAEMVITGDGTQFYGQEKGGDFYSASDLLLDKVEKQLVRFKEKHQLHKGSHLGEMNLVDVNIEDRFGVIVEEASAKPVDEVEAFLEMRLDNREFLLFKKGERTVEGSGSENRNYSVLFKSDGAFRIAEIPADSFKKGGVPEDLVEYDVRVVSESASSPKIECRKSSTRQVKMMKITDAVNELIGSERGFVPFFNRETNHMNVIFNRGKNIGVMIPSSE